MHSPLASRARLGFALPSNLLGFALAALHFVMRLWRHVKHSLSNPQRRFI
jgi:hypothetical protein